MKFMARVALHLHCHTPLVAQVRKHLKFSFSTIVSATSHKMNSSQTVSKTMKLSRPKLHDVARRFPIRIYYKCNLGDFGAGIFTHFNTRDGQLYFHWYSHL